MHRLAVFANVVIGSNAAVSRVRLGEIGLVAELAAEDRIVEDVRIIDYRMNHRHLGLVARDS